MVGQLLPGDRVTAYCTCGRVAPVSVRKLQRRFPPRTDFAAVAEKFFCQGTKEKPGCGSHTPSLLGFYDDRLTWLYVAEPRQPKDRT